MENNEADPVQAPLPPPERAPRRLMIPHEITFQAYEFKNTKRFGLPLPKKAPAIEAKEFPFNKKKDTTGSELGDLHKRGVYEVQDLIGDKRREVLHMLPMNKKNKGQLKQLRVELDGLKDKLVKKIDEMRKATGIILIVPYHFDDFPALEA